MSLAGVTGMGADQRGTDMMRLIGLDTVPGTRMETEAEAVTGPQALTQEGLTGERETARTEGKPILK